MSNFQLMCINVMMVMFFTSGVDKIANFDKTVRGLIKKVHVHQNISKFAIISAILIEIIAPIAINYGHFYDKDIAALALASLIIFTILATAIYHFPPIGRQYYPFMSNLTTIGGLMLALTLYL